MLTINTNGGRIGIRISLVIILRGLSPPHPHRMDAAAPENTAGLPPSTRGDHAVANVFRYLVGLRKYEIRKNVLAPRRRIMAV